MRAGYLANTATSPCTLRLSRMRSSVSTMVAPVRSSTSMWRSTRTMKAMMSGSAAAICAMRVRLPPTVAPAVSLLARERTL